MTKLMWTLAALSLLACLIAAFLFFAARVSETGYKTTLALASLAWFICATLAIRRRARP